MSASLEPEALAAIADLELVSRRIVDGTISGLHRSPFHGYSAEFSQYRHYRPGDDLKYIDWKLFARTDRLYTKQFRETTNLVCQVALDASASMDYGGATGGVTKFRVRATAWRRRWRISSPARAIRWTRNLCGCLAAVPAKPRRAGASAQPAARRWAAANPGGGRTVPRRWRGRSIC